MNFEDFIGEAYKDLPVDKINRQMRKPHALRDTEKFKQMAQQKYEYGDENPGWGEGGKIRDAHEKRTPERAAKAYKKRKEDKEKSNREGKGTHQKIVPGIKGSKKDNLEDTLKKESINFSEFLDSAVHPLYEKEGDLPKCPPGYRYDQKLVMCVPKTPKDSVGRGEKSGDKDLKPGQGAHYNVWGNTGVDGAGYAWEEGPTTNDKASGAYG